MNDDSVFFHLDIVEFVVHSDLSWCVVIWPPAVQWSYIPNMKFRNAMQGAG